MISCRWRAHPLLYFLPPLLLSPLLIALVVDGALANSASGFVIIVNSSNPVTSLTPTRVARIFTKKESQWDGGLSIRPVDLRTASRLRRQFTRSIHGKSIEALENFWRKQIFTGRAVPPPEKSTEKDVLDFVMHNRGAIGYVSKRTPLIGVKSISLDR